MALLQKNTYGVGNTDLTNLMAVVDMQRKGHINIEVDTSNKQIEAGSVIDINGGWFYTDSDTNISDNGTAWAALATSSIFYVYAVGGGTDEFQYSTTVPAYSSELGGWYNGTDRAIIIAFKDGSDNFADYGIYGIDNDRDGVFLLRKEVDIGDWDMDASSGPSVAHGLGVLWLNTRMISVIIRDDADTERIPVSQFSEPTGYAAEVKVMTSTVLVLTREAGGSFDGVLYNATSYNRGWITIWYELS